MLARPVCHRMGQKRAAAVWGQRAGGRRFQTGQKRQVLVQLGQQELEQESLPKRPYYEAFPQRDTASSLPKGSNGASCALGLSATAFQSIIASEIDEHLSGCDLHTRVYLAPVLVLVLVLSWEQTSASFCPGLELQQPLAWSVPV